MLKKHERFVGQFEAKAEESVWGSSNSIAAVDVVDSPEFCEIFFHSRVWSSRWRVVKVNTCMRERGSKEEGRGWRICMWVLWQMQLLHFSTCEWPSPLPTTRPSVLTDECGIHNCHPQIGKDQLPYFTTFTLIGIYPQADELLRIRVVFINVHFLESVLHNLHCMKWA